MLDFSFIKKFNKLHPVVQFCQHLVFSCKICLQYNVITYFSI